jgi:xylan 1,4-beta-xylosidase
MAPVSGKAAGQTDRATIEVDATSTMGPLEPIWAYFGYDEANYTNTPEGEELLRTLARVHPTPVRLRTHFLFNTGDGTPELKWGSTNVYTAGADGNPTYDYSLIDAIMDATVGAGTLPLFQFGFMPQALSTRPDPYKNSNTYVLDGGCFYPPNDYGQWGALVSAWAEHVKERYP